MRGAIPGRTMRRLSVVRLRDYGESSEIELEMLRGEGVGSCDCLLSSGHARFAVRSQLCSGKAHQIE